jgi:murein DD-endopeptidase MepM/ murein hydrolase activator NlpD
VTLRALAAAGLIVTLVPAVVLSAPAPPRKSKAKPTAAKRIPDVDAARGERATPAKAPAVVVHDVQRGDTLSAIAMKYKVTVASLVIANRLRGPRARLALGQQLTIPRPRGAPTLRGRRGPVDEPLPVSLVLSVPDFGDAPAFQWPVIGPVTSMFGRRSRTWHRGVDIRADGGTPIVAAAAGVVIASGFEARYGQMVKVEHDGGFVTVYAHNERNVVEVGQDVQGGQVIAVVGRTGRATAEHVHFEIRYEGRAYNPLYLLPNPPRSVQIELTAAEPHDDDE